MKRSALVKRALECVPKSAVTSHSGAPKAHLARRSAEQTDLGEGWNHVVRGGHVVKATTTPPPNPKPSLRPVTEAPSQPKVTAISKKAGPMKTTRNVQQSLCRPLG
jgi:hypothetical protein